MRTSLALTVLAVAVAALLVSGTPVQAQYYGRAPGYGPARPPGPPAYGPGPAYGRAPAYAMPRGYAGYYGGTQGYVPRPGWNGGFGNGYPNGFSNGYPNGFSNGYPNGFSNGYPNGFSNGFNRYPTWTRNGYGPGPLTWNGRMYGR